MQAPGEVAAAGQLALGLTARARARERATGMVTATTTCMTTDITLVTMMMSATQMATILKTRAQAALALGASTLPQRAEALGEAGSDRVARLTPRIRLRLVLVHLHMGADDLCLERAALEMRSQRSGSAAAAAALLLVVVQLAAVAQARGGLKGDALQVPALLCSWAPAPALAIITRQTT